MKATRLRFALLIFLLLFSLMRFLGSGSEGVQVSKVIDPFLFFAGYSSGDKDTRTVTTTVTSPSPLTASQRMELGSIGLVTGSVGRVATVQVPFAALGKIARLDFVSEVFASRSYHPALDVSAREIGAAFVWQNVTDITGKAVDGSGVAVGVIDTGVDLSHPDLRFRNGTSKVLYLWDQTLSGKPPQGFTYGVECSPSEINGGRCAEKDTFGHGTHVASIAVGSGLASGMYQGIAPGASLIVVKSGAPMCDGGWIFSDSAIIDGLQYLVERARALGMRLVINLSFGGNIGGHDDTGPLEIALDILNAQGIVVTVAAGNEADNQAHATGSIGQTNPVQVSWGPAGQAHNAVIDIWYPDDRAVSATLITPSGKGVAGPTPANGTGTPDGLVTILSGATDRGKEVAISIEAENAIETSGWKVILNVEDSGPPLGWDAWVDSDSCSHPAASIAAGAGYTIDAGGTVTVPGTATGAITVGAYVSKDSWVSRLGKNVLIQGYRVGEMAPFSSRGPTRDGRTKPDVSAPGLFIAAARASDVPMVESDPDQYHRLLAGTSMAAPHVAGLVALMLQYKPQLTSQEIRSLLATGTYLDTSTGFIDAYEGSNEWGWGKVDARTTTSLFRVSSALPSLPPAFAVNFIVDGEPSGVLHGGEVRTMRFQSGSFHRFRVMGETFTANATRYMVAGDDSPFSANGAFKPNVQVQFLLSLESPVGRTDGEGWYDAGTYADFTVNSPEVSGGLGQLLGVTFFFDHWVDEHGNRVPPGSLLMDSPHTLRATWDARLTDRRPVLVLVAFVLALALVLEFRGRGLRKKRGVSTEKRLMLR